jgi:hypothetical protein
VNDYDLEWRVRAALVDLAEHEWVILGDPVVVRRIRDACREGGFDLRVTWRLPGYFYCELVRPTLAQQVERLGYNLGLPTSDNR